MEINFKSGIYMFIFSLELVSVSGAAVIYTMKGFVIHTAACLMMTQLVFLTLDP